MKRALVAIAAVGSVGAAVVALTTRRRDVTENRSSAAKTVTVCRSAEDMYGMWRDAARLPDFVRGLRSVEVASNGLQRWTVGKGKRTTVFDVAIARDIPGRLLEWRTIGHSPFAGQASLAFTPLASRNATEVRLSIAVMGPGASVASALARPFGASVEQIARESLRTFKALAEAGEVPKAVRS